MHGVVFNKKKMLKYITLYLNIPFKSLLAKNKNKFASVWFRHVCGDALIWYRKGWQGLSVCFLFVFFFYPTLSHHFHLQTFGSQNKKTELSFVLCVCPEERNWHPWNFSRVLRRKGFCEEKTKIPTVGTRIFIVCDRDLLEILCWISRKNFKQSPIYH